MERISSERVKELLSGPHQAVLSLSREAKGPLAVPMSYIYDGDRFVMVTSPASLHSRLMRRNGRATITVQFEACDGRSVHQWYVIAEGHVAFTDEDPRPFVRAILAKDRGSENADDWMQRTGDADDTVAELLPARISGFESSASLG